MASLSSIPDIVNQEEHEYQDLNNDLGNWNIPKIPVKEIYRSSLLGDSFRTDQIAKTVKQVYAITKQEEKCSLLSKDSIKRHLERGLKDKNILKALTLNIQTAGAITNMLEGSHPLALIYCIYYKCMKTNLNIHALVKSPKDKTVLIQSNTNANIQVPKTISWSDIKLSTSWISENESYPQKMQNDIIDLDYIKQYLDGTVRISFDQQRINPPLRILELSIETSSQISKPCYSTQSKFDDEETSQGSPTPTDLDEITPNDSISQRNVDPSLRVLNRITNDNNDEYDELYEEYKSKKNKQKRKDYRNKYSFDEQDKIIDCWEQYMKDKGIEIYFFDYLENFYKTPKQKIKTTKSRTLSSVCSNYTPYLTFQTCDKEIKI
ncbi:hypothetical protein RHMOL_Rhmol07G0201800 [Rhododendron molle]|uniref:Uncharacterized protein n=1 Tax=Rhododendron molle TaxID=49168 RepID=A0ACC0N310_RHOML|nr:hypothetical protein RHMOL_Rhmol07G0201800 [Rhododendron molle]